MYKRLTGEQWDLLYKDICHGDESAEAFARLWSGYCHALDDIVDGEDLIPEKLLSLFHDSMKEFSFNEFYNAHKVQLFPLMVQAFNTYLDSVRWEENGNDSEKLHANVLRVQYDSVTDHVAYITSGYDFDRLRELSSKYRDLVWKDVNSKKEDKVKEPWLAN